MSNSATNSIIIDSREQRAYEFSDATESALTTGDYSIQGLEDRVTIERKTKGDLYNCIGNDRERFEMNWRGCLNLI